jgi:hypothetical protein
VALRRIDAEERTPTMLAARTEIPLRRRTASSRIQVQRSNGLRNDTISDASRS